MYENKYTRTSFDGTYLQSTTYPGAAIAHARYTPHTHQVRIKYTQSIHEVYTNILYVLLAPAPIVKPHLPNKYK